VWLTSFGCQMNLLDAELVAGDLARRGWAKAESMDDADVVLLQTCSVREHAEDKVWSLLGRARLLKQERPGMLIGVLGCMAQRAKEEIVRRAPYVDLVLGTSSFRTAVDDLDDLAARGGRIQRTDRTPPPERLPDADRDVTQRPDPYRAYVTVMRGCDHVCSYCIVPFTRGREVSRPLAEVVDEVRRLADDGVREVTFLGQNINTYGKDLGEGGLPALLERSAGVAGIERLRFLTSNPFDMTEDMMRRMGAVPQVMPWLHIPAQSGDDAVLQRMKRTYSVAQYEEVVGWARRHVPGVEITSDFIVGFPGETDAQFQASVALVERVGFLQTYVFKYSVRPRTLSARRLPDDVPEDVKKRRNNELLEAQDRTAARRQASLVGTEVEILVEGPSKTDPTRVTGRDRYNRLVHAGGDGVRLAGRLVRVEVTESSAHCLLGRIVGGDGR
jgi:tRNA-2-methylthio-N6-dimethylallyladenosine synthase